jgi:hypothetical protein
MRSRTLLHGLAAVAVVAATLASTSAALAQSRGEDEREQTYLDGLRREDAAAAERYIALRDARAQALADMRKVEAQYNGAGAQLRGLFVNALRQARKKYVESSLALIDFFDARDRLNIGRYQEEIGRLNALIAERQRTRAELEKLIAP